MLNIYQSFQTWIFLEHTNQTYSWYVSNTLLMTDYRNRTLLPSMQLQALHFMAPEPPWRLPSWSRIWPPTFWQQYSFPQTDFSSNPPPAPESQKFVTGCITPFKIHFHHSAHHTICRIQFEISSSFHTHTKDSTIPNHTWHLSRTTSYSLLWSWHQTPAHLICSPTHEPSFLHMANFFMPEHLLHLIVQLNSNCSLIGWLSISPLVH